VPEHVWKIAKPYQLTPNDGEQKILLERHYKKGND